VVSARVCDDDADTLEVVGAMLHAQGFRSIGVQTGQEAVERATAEHPAAIVLDLAMPGMDGWETLVALKARPETREIPVLILSGVERTGMEPVDTDQVWMAKPVSADILRDMLERTLGRRPGPPRVLVVEDDPGLAGILTEGLAASGVETQHATNSKRAIALTRNTNPDLLLLDLKLAAGSGLEVVDSLRERDQLRRVPIVIYSARDRISPEAVQDRVMTLLRHFT
jgi:CheY-like chemotaxis protein